MALAVDIISLRSPDTPNKVVKYAVKKGTRDIVGTIDMEKQSKSIYSGEKFSPFYVAESSQYSVKAKPHIHINDLYVEEAYRGQGVGTKLLKSAVKESVDKGCEGRVILLAGNNTQSPLAFYRKSLFTTCNNALNKMIDNAIQYRTTINKDIQSFMILPKNAIAKVLKSI